MDNSVKKWLIRAGSFLILFGFFIPSMAVSCSVYGMSQEQSFSMSSAASQADQGILYLVLIGILITLVFSFLLPRSSQQRSSFIIGETGGLGLGILSILISVISLSSQMQQLGLEFKVKAGFFVLFFGYCMAGFGVIQEFFEPAQPSFQPQQDPPPDFAPAPPPPIFPPSSPIYSSGGGGSPHLELVSGKAPKLIELNNPDFHIGRSRQNHYSINDPQISRVHIRIRGSQGSWFIQDQGSSSGTFINNSRIQAQRLKDGDQIRIGETTFRFRM